MYDKKLRIGFIGLGSVAHMKHLPSLAKYPEQCELVAFCDLDREKAQKAAEQYGTADAKVYTDYHQMLKEADIDVVHVLTHNSAHCEATVACFEAGKHVMCEKPMAVSSEEAKRMIDAWKKSGKKFTIGYQNRFRPEIQMMHQACEDGDLGEIYFAKAHAVRRRGVPVWGVFCDKEKQGGGPLIDIGTHALDITLWMMDNYEPYSVSGITYDKLRNKPEGNNGGPWNPEKMEVEDSAFGLIKMKNGSSIFLEASWALNTRLEKQACATLYGTKGGAEIENDKSPNRGTCVINDVRYGALGEYRPSQKGEIDMFKSDGEKPGVIEAGQWLDAILHDTDPLVMPEQAFVVTQILEGIYKSAESGKEYFF